MRFALLGVALMALSPSAANAEGGADASQRNTTQHDTTETKTFATCEEASQHYQERAGQAFTMPVPFQPYRIITPHTFVTLDFNPLRLNIHVDDAGVILKATCG